MRILHVNMALTGGGLEQYLYQLFEELDRRGHTNSLIYGERSRELWPVPYAKTFLIDKITHPKCPNLSPKIETALEIMEHEQPDLVFFHQALNPRLIDCITRIKPSVRFVHGFKMICPEGKKILKTKESICDYPLRWLCQVRAYRYKCMPRNIFLGLFLLSSSKRVARSHRKRSTMVVGSQFMRRVLVYNGFPEAQIEVIPPFTKLPVAQDRIAESDGSLILTVGRVVPGKGIEYLIHAFSRLRRNVRLVVAGDGPGLDALKELSIERGLGSQISFTGWLSHDQLGELYRTCTLVVVPSSWPEPFGMVGIEAMAYQKPVVAFDVGGISEWLKDGETGFLVPPRDITGLAEKIDLLLSMPDFAEQMGRAGRENVKARFLPHHHVDRLISVFHKAIEDFSSRAE